MSDVTVFEHQGHPIVKTVFRPSSDLGALKAVLAQTGMAYAKLPAGSILALVVFQNQEFDETMINLFEAVAKANATVVRATAFLGIEGPQTALFKAMISLTGRQAKMFATEADALAWLLNAESTDPLAGL